MRPYFNGYCTELWGEYMRQKNQSRRQFMKNMGVGASGALLATTGLPAAFARPASNPAGAAALFQANTVGLGQTGPEVEVIVGDVLGFSLTSDQWKGQYGWVTLQLHQAFYNGQAAYYIRTDASDQAFATEQKLVWVPLLNAALAAEGAASKLYMFANGVPEQAPVMSVIPGQETYSSAWHFHRVTFKGAASLLNSAEAITQAEAAGTLTVEATRIIVNYPVVKWPGGELPADPDKVEPLGKGPLITPVDTDNMQVTFKLHQCYPGSRYIVTDTSAAPMAPMMSIAAAPPTQALMTSGATDKIWVFANGIPGSGVMGFQPAVFGHKAGNPVWSPFWNHFTLKWKDPAKVVVLKSPEEVQARLDAGDIEQFNGTPDSHPNGFVVNCPAPILARNTFVG
jgi:hypothetical protein